MSDKPKIAVLLATLESHNHIIGDVERGVKIYEKGGYELHQDEDGTYWGHIPHKDGYKAVSLAFTRDGSDLKQHYCMCVAGERNPPICRHIVAAVLSIQGGVMDSKLKLGKTAKASTTVTYVNTAKAIGSGSLDVFATPMMIALMESAACECLADVLEPGQTSVGTKVDIAHNAASPVGANITATATIESVSGNKITFAVTASDSAGEIGSGKHTRVIVDAERFVSRAIRTHKS